MGTSKLNAGRGNPTMDQHPIRGELEILLVASCYRNQDKLWSDGPVGSYADFKLLLTYLCLFTGTASVTVAGLLAALRITKNKLADHKFLFQGAGEVGKEKAKIIQKDSYQVPVVQNVDNAIHLVNHYPVDKC